MDKNPFSIAEVLNTFEAGIVVHLSVTDSVLLSDCFESVSMRLQENDTNSVVENRKHKGEKLFISNFKFVCLGTAPPGRVQKKDVGVVLLLILNSGLRCLLKG